MGHFAWGRPIAQVGNEPVPIGSNDEGFMTGVLSGTGEAGAQWHVTGTVRLKPPTDSECMTSWYRKASG